MPTAAAGVVRVVDVLVRTLEAAATRGTAPLYAASTRDTLALTPRVAVTVVPAVPATAVRVNTHDGMSGDPSCREPSNVHPVGVVAVVLAFAVTT